MSVATVPATQLFASADVNAVLDAWKEFDLDGKRLLLDKNCAEMKELKTASITGDCFNYHGLALPSFHELGRKRLNEVTKSFRSNSKEEQVCQIFASCNHVDVSSYTVGSNAGGTPCISRGD